MSEPFDPTPSQDRRTSWRSLSSQHRGSQVQQDVQRAGLGLNTADGRANGAAAPQRPRIQGQSQGQSQAGTPNTKIANLQREIDDTVGIMQKNIEGMAERGEHLQTLQQKTDDLSIASQTFRKKAGDVRRQMWWKNMKWWFIIGGVLLLFIIGGIVGGLKGKEVVHVISGDGEKTAENGSGNPATASHDQPRNGDVEGFPIFGGAGGFANPIAPAGYEPVSVDRKRSLEGESDVGEEGDASGAKSSSQSAETMNEQQQVGQGDASGEGVEGRDVYKHAPPAEGGLGKSKRGGLIGIEHLPYAGQNQYKRNVASEDTNQSVDAINTKAAHEKRHDDPSHATEDSPRIAGYASDAESRSATSQLKPRNTPKTACLRKRDRKGRALEGKFGRRSADGKRWFLAA